jgi:hypothetical protein
MHCFFIGGELMANEQNLIPGGHKLTQEEQSKGGKASGEARRNKKLLRDCIDYLLEREDKATIGVDGSPMSGAEQLAYNLFIKALTETDTGKAAKAFEVLRDTAGQKPVEKVETKQTVIDMSGFTTEQLKEMLDNDITECD